MSAQAEAPGDGASEGAASTKESYLVYVVDDDPAFIEQVKDHLHKTIPSFLRVRSFATPGECLEHALQKPDMIFIEHTTAHSASPELHALSRIKNVFNGVPVVVLTRNSDLGVVVKSMRTGAYSYVLKNREAFERIGKLVSKTIQRLRINRMHEKEERNKLLIRIGIPVLILVILLLIYLL